MRPIIATVKKKGKWRILHDHTLAGGIGAEIRAWINDNYLSMPDGLVLRRASQDTPVPFNADHKKSC